MSKYRAARQPERHLTMLRQPDRWPYWPMLPVKRYTVQQPIDIQVGVVYEQKPTEVVLTSIWSDREQFNNAERIEYASIEALVADGWEVD